ncbi:MAG: sensor histidine kinase [Actinobacteria bacterium]|nr:sensor histidine kinase [Actinomycetota bacterium]
MGARRWLILVVVAATALTLLVSVASVVQFAYRSPSLHVAVETAAALISLLAAQLMYGRFRRSLDRRDLLLTAALVLFAGANLLFSAVPAAANMGIGTFDTWAPALSRVLAAALFAAGAFAAPRPIRRPGPASARMLGLCAVALGVIAAGTALAGDALPLAIDPGLSPEAASRPRIVGAPSLLALQLVVMALFAAAAIAFAVQAERTGDPLTLWFAIGATLAAFARLNYFLFPSLYSEFFYVGDVLRLGFFVALLIGGVLEIRVAQRELERAAVFDERRRLAREIHDGMAQDLVFIVQQASALEPEDGDREAVADIVTAARRALDESRGAIAALVRPTDEPLAQALARVAEETAGRWGASVESQMVDGFELSPPTREALLRIVGEAVANAARHGQAQRIRVELAQRPQLHVRIVDDGVGFDVTSVEELRGRHGIMGMRERAEQLGGRLHVNSRPGEGTEITVVLP